MLTINVKAKELKMSRIKKGLGIRDLALKAGLNSITVWKIENGGTSPKPSTVKKICDAMDASFDDLFEVVENYVREA